MDELSEAVSNAKDINRREGELNRQLQQDNRARAAEFEFIETHYDYTTNVNEMNINLFENIVRSNREVNETVEKFQSRVDVV